MSDERRVLTGIDYILNFLDVLNGKKQSCKALSLSGPNDRTIHPFNDWRKVKVKCYGMCNYFSDSKRRFNDVLKLSLRCLSKII